MELWASVKGFEDRYEVSSKGNVRSLSRKEETNAGWSRNRSGRTLKQNYGNGQKKYRRVQLRANNYTLVHRLVAQTFIPNPHNLPFINHKNKDTTNNCVENLEWVTQRQNMVHSHGKPFKLTKDDKVHSFDSVAEAANFLSSNNGNVSRLVNKVKYHHIKGWRLYES